MQVELTVGRVPWKELTDINQVGQAKQNIRNTPDKMFVHPCPAAELKQIMTMIDSWDYFADPNYAEIYRVGTFSNAFTL